MDFLKSLWPNSSPNVITIPQHIEGELEDDVDLKVKSLLYIYKRLSIALLPGFLQDENGVFDLKLNVRDHDPKLDAIYNVSEFERLLCSDEHRILIDWFKNRFRSICILSGRPSYTFETQLGDKFSFQVLPPGANDEEYVSVIVDSDLYVEHSIDRTIKVRLLQEVISQQRQLRPSYKKFFNKNDRANIILEYLHKLSEQVQIERIYKASITSRLDSKPKLDIITESDPGQENGVKLFPSNRSRSRSPKRHSDKVLEPLNITLQPTIKLTPPSSPVKSITPSSSPSRLRSRPSSPVKLKKKQSMTLLKMDHLVDEVTSDGELSKDELSLIRQQSEQAVLFRVERERRLLRG